MQRRDEREALELQQRDQREIDELASTRHHAGVRADAREELHALRLLPAGDGVER
jgi:hypothetical protein